MDFLLEAARELERDVFFSVTDVLSLEVDFGPPSGPAASPDTFWTHR